MRGGILKWELGLSGAGRVFQDGLNVAQPGVPVLLGFSAGVVDCGGGVFFRQGTEADDGPQGGVAAFVDEVLRPESAGGAQEGGAVGPVFDGCGEGGGHAGAAERATEGAGFEAVVVADGVTAMIEDAHHAEVPADPDFVADVLGGDFVIGAGDFHEAVAPDFAAAFFVNGEEGGGEWLQEGPLLGARSPSVAPHARHGVVSPASGRSLDCEGACASREHARSAWFHQSESPKPIIQMSSK